MAIRNSKLSQPAAIRYELGDHHTYDFVEGNVPWAVDPGESIDRDTETHKPSV
jgi:hypothetical protein